MLTNTDPLVAPLAYAQAIRSILLVKLDHIGDFFIATPAFRRLREAFPNSEITLVCGPWNRQLALSLDLFDKVLPFSLFPEQTREQTRLHQDPNWVAMMHRQFAALVGGPYDLAVDLRYDSETRRLLTMVPATYRVGIGDTGQFPFLDLALPSDVHHVRPDQADGERRSFSVGFAPNGGVYFLRADRTDLALTLMIDNPASPRELGLWSDPRRLGIALRQAKLTRRVLNPGLHSETHPIWDDPGTPTHGESYGLEETISFAVDAPPGPMRLALGFAAREATRVWTEHSMAQVSLPFQTGLSADLRLCLLIEGFVPANHPRQGFTLACNGRKVARAVIENDESVRTLVVPLQRDLLDAASTIELSEEFSVELGQCSIRVAINPLGVVDLLGRSVVDIEVINAVERVLARSTFTGPSLSALGRNEVSFFQDDPGSPLRVRIRVTGRPFGIGLEIGAVQVTCVFKKFAPKVHMMDWVGLLADTVVRRFAPTTDLLGLPSAMLPIDLQERLAADRSAGRKVIIVATGANKEVTKWLLPYFGTLVGLLVAAIPCTVYLVGTARESVEAEQVLADNGNALQIVNLCGLTSLVQLGTLVREADLFVGNSTGTTHAAAMSGTPTLALLSAANHPHQWAPVGANADFLSLDVPCRQCHILFMSQCGHGYRCMVGLAPDLVFNRAKQMLSAGRREADPPARSA